ncbi:MAG: selenide, water dikinase SelD [Thermodesulfobacteriota bacterium]
MRRARRSGAAPARVRCRLVLAGGGHSHVHVLRMLARTALEGVEVTLVSPRRTAVYTGMIPGWLAGLYADDDPAIDVAALAARAGAAFLPDRVRAIDPARRVVELGLRGALPYDVLSLDVGARPAGTEDVRGFAHVVPIKPIEEAAERIGRLVDRAREAGRMSAVVVGGGAGGAEIAFALRTRLAAGARSTVTLLERDAEVLAGAAPRARRLLAQLAGRYGIALRSGVGPVAPCERGVRLGDGAVVEADLVVWATGAEGQPFLAASGLACDARGFLLVDDELRCIGQRDVFAAGDCSVLRSAPWVPRAGVHAVRQGPVLTHNLVATATGRGRLRPYRPQKRFLTLLSTGDRRALLSRGRWASHGRRWWWLKDWIDRRFVARHAPPRSERLRPPPSGAAAAMEPCGGCAAKLEADVLAGVLCDVTPGAHEAVAIGLAAPDDAAVLRYDGGRDVVTTIDAFPPFLSDPRTVGEIAAVNAASDVFAMGGEPSAALALVALPEADARGAAAELRQILEGASAAFARMGAALAGGHTVQAPARLVGFWVHGMLARDGALTKGGARPGDALVLTKPLGTAVILAAARAGECPARWVDAALDAMREDNGAAARVLRTAGVRCCTDVSGFGLAGHLVEVLRASGVGAALRLAALPALPGALELLEAGWRSSAHAATRALLAGARVADEARAPALAARVELLCDPQTSGGLLAAVPPAALPDVLAGLQRAGVLAAVVGEVTDEREVLRVAAGGEQAVAAPRHRL